MLTDTAETIEILISGAYVTPNQPTPATVDWEPWVHTEARRFAERDGQRRLIGEPTLGRVMDGPLFGFGPNAWHAEFTAEVLPA